MRVVNLVQGTQAWLDWRVGGIGSSDAMVIAAAHGMIERKPWMATLDDLFEEKMTGVSRVIENPRMKRGKDSEAAARAAFEHAAGMVVQPLCAEMDGNPQIKASFDGISLDGDEYTEIKCPHEAVHELAKQKVIVDYYVPQVAHQGLVAWGHPSQWPAHGALYFVSYVPETGDIAIVKKLAAEIAAFATELYDHEIAFLDSLRRGVPPCGAEYAALAEKYLAIEIEVKKLDSVKEKLRAAMIEVATRRNVKAIDGCGVTLTEQSKSGSIDYGKLCAHYSITNAEQETYRKKGSTFWQVRVDATRASENAPQVASALVEQGNVTQVIETVADDFWGSFAPSESNRERATTASTHARAA